MFTIFGFTVGMPVLWIIALVIFIIIEALTMGLTTIWFAGGCLVALVLALLDVPLWVQIVVFLVVSVVLLVFTRKIFIDKLHTGREKTNVEALVGRKGKVTEKVGCLEPGAVLIWGQTWTALCSEEEGSIYVDKEVEVIAIEGVKAIVKEVK